VGLQLKEVSTMLRIFISAIIILIHVNAYAYPIRQIDGTVEKIIDRTIIINEEKFRPSGYASALPQWVVEGSVIKMSYACNELGECYYIDIVETDGKLSIMNKINQELLNFERVFP
jgi:predicted GTPase